MTETQVKIAHFHRFFHEIPLFKGDFSLYNSFVRKINRSFREIHSTVRCRVILSEGQSPKSKFCVRKIA